MTAAIATRVAKTLNVLLDVWALLMTGCCDFEDMKGGWEEERKCTYTTVSYLLESSSVYSETGQRIIFSTVMLRQRGIGSRDELSN